MGVKQVKLKTCFDFYHADETSKVWGRLFACTYDGQFNLDPEEVESGEFMSVQVRMSTYFAIGCHDEHACWYWEGNLLTSMLCMCACLTCWSVFTLQEVKELLSKGQVPPDSKACLDRFLATD